MIGKNWEKYLSNCCQCFTCYKEKTYPAYVSKHNPNRETQVTTLMILNIEGWHYLAVKKLPPLLRGIMSKHYGEFYC